MSSVVGHCIQSLPVLCQLDTSLCCLSKLGRALEKCHILVHIVLDPLHPDLHVVVVAVTAVPHSGRHSSLHGFELRDLRLQSLAKVLHRVCPSQHSVPNLGPNRLGLSLGFPPHQLPDDDLLLLPLLDLLVTLLQVGDDGLQCER